MARWLLFAALAGCGHAAPARSTREIGTTPDAAATPDVAALDDDLPRLAARATQLYQELAAALAGAADCAATSAKLEAIESTYSDVIDANARMKRATRDKTRALEEALQPYAPALGVAMHAIADAAIVQQCASDPRFVAAIDRLQGGS